MNEKCKEDKVPHKKLTKKKAKEILRHGSVRGHRLTRKQRGFFGARAGGAPVKRATRRKKQTKKK